jgi:hypothetical protein
MTGNGGKLDAQWPTGLDGFEEAVTRYHADCRSVSAALMRGFAIALGLPPDRFEGDIDDPFTKLRLLRYPAKSAGTKRDVSPGTEGADPYVGDRAGCGAHTDWGALTLLVQDDVGGLEVCPPRTSEGDSDEAAAPAWMPADAKRGAILANVGDMLLRWTDGRYRSAPHRVLEPKVAGVDRYSVAFFLNCNVDAAGGRCGARARARRYRRQVAPDHRHGVHRGEGSGDVLGVDRGACITICVLIVQCPWSHPPSACIAAQVKVPTKIAATVAPSLPFPSPKPRIVAAATYTNPPAVNPSTTAPSIHVGE